jgi:hypothetical protein
MAPTREWATAKRWRFCGSQLDGSQDIGHRQWELRVEGVLFFPPKSFLGKFSYILVVEVPVGRIFNFLERHVGSVNCFRVEQSSTQYREFAEECRRLAQLAQTAEERKVLQEREAAWTKLAGEVERKAAQGSG